jgi:hypothetical protein
MATVKIILTDKPGGGVHVHLDAGNRRPGQPYTPAELLAEGLFAMLEKAELSAKTPTATNTAAEAA